jgi:hypothetical protein
MMRTAIAVLSFSCALICYSPSALASLHQGLFRLGLDSTLFCFRSINEEANDHQERVYDIVAFGVGIPNAGLNIGGTVLNGLVLVVSQSFTVGYKQ